MKKLIKSILKRLDYLKYNKHYYNLNKPLVDDDIDKLKLEIINLENKHNFLNHKDLSNSVGFKPSKIFKN